MNKKTPLILDPLCGTHISRAFKDAINLSQTTNRRVQFCFNGKRVNVHKRLSVKHLLFQFDERCEALSRRYRTSKEGITQRQKYEMIQKECQDAVNSMVKMLPEILENDDIDEIIEWIQTLTQHTNRANVDFDIAAGVKSGGMEWICVLFESKGFDENYGVGNTPEWFNTKYRTGHYIIGQVMHCLRLGYAPLGVTSKFCEQYFAQASY